MKFSLMLSLAFAMLLVLSGSAFAADDIVPQAERDVSYTGVGGVKLAGTLLVPAHRQGAKVPGLIIVAGSGPTDRDGNSSVLAGQKIDTYKYMAEALAAHGVASLRYDKRGVGKSQPIPQPKDPKNYTDAEKQELIDFVDWSNYVGDVAATLGVLQQQAEIDPARTAMLGHSEGGMLIVQAAAEGKGFSQPPAALILAASPGRPYDALLREQIAALLKKQGADAATTKLYLDNLDEILTSLKNDGKLPSHIEQGLAALFPAYLVKFYQHSFQNDPATLAAQFAGPVLILQGGNDANVSPERDAQLLYDALNKRGSGDQELDIIPGLSHEFKAAKDVNDPGIAGNVDSRILDKLGTWAAQKLGAETVGTPVAVAQPSATMGSTPAATSASPTSTAPTSTSTNLSSDNTLTIVALTALGVLVLGIGSWLIFRKPATE